MTAEEFEVGYCERSGITREYYRKWFATMTCQCDYESCEGWAAIHNTPDMIKDQQFLYGGELV